MRIELKLYVLIEIYYKLYLAFKKNINKKLKYTMNSYLTLIKKM